MRKTEIIEAAARVFSTKGYYHAKIQEIADEANMGKGTVYEYFTSKKELFTETIKLGTKRVEEITDQELSRPEPFWLRLYHLQKKYVDYLWENREFACLLMGRESQLITEKELFGLLLQVRKNIIKRLENAFREAMNEGVVVSGNPALYAKLLHGITNQVIVESLLIDKQKPTPHDIEATIRVLMDGIKTDEAELVVDNT